MQYVILLNGIGTEYIVYDIDYIFRRRLYIPWHRHLIVAHVCNMHIQFFSHTYLMSTI